MTRVNKITFFPIGREKTPHIFTSLVSLSLQTLVPSLLSGASTGTSHVSVQCEVTRQQQVRTGGGEHPRETIETLANQPKEEVDKDRKHSL